MRAGSLGMLAAVFLLAAAGRADPEPWSDADPPAPPVRHPFGDFGAEVGAEYRAQILYVNGLAVNSLHDTHAGWLDHRLRLDGAADYDQRVRLVLSMDLLDGVIWGDNGTFGQEPAPNSGANVTTRNPNTNRPCIGLRDPSEDPLEGDSYGYVDCAGNDVRIRKAYGELVTPVGLFRIGRQPTTLGTGVAAADGDGRPNRFGISRTGNLVDRILFATKPLEAFVPKERRDRSQQRGLVLVAGYDRLVTDTVRHFNDDVHQIVSSIRLLQPGYAPRRSLELALYDAYRWDVQFETRVNVFGWRALARFGDFYAGAEAVMNVGTTREISEAYSLVQNDPVVDQAIRQWGGRAVVRYDRPRWGAYLEVDYASGDENPDPRSALKQFYFAEDANVGLLLFEQVLAFQSARAAAAGNELLRRLGSKTFPADVVASRGAFTNAVAVFPQFDVHPHPTVLLRGGVLAAWAPARVVDPIASLKRRDGRTIEDDLVNLNGGKPARYYGTELDGRFQWRYADHFALDVEGAVLFPGDAFEDENGQAIRSVLVQGRTTFFF